MKKLFTLFVGAVVGLGAYAQDFDSGGLMYSVLSPEDKTCTVRGFAGEQNPMLVIPETVSFEEEEYTVTEVGERAFMYAGLNSIALPSTLEVLRSYAFYNIGGLSEVVIPNSVKEIEGACFAYCYNIGRVELGSSLETIGNIAFEGCPIAVVVVSGVTPAKFGEEGYNSVFTSNPLVAVPDGLISEYQNAWEGANIVPNIPAASLAFDSYSYSVMPGSSVQLSWTVEPVDAPIRFSTSSPDVITVDNEGLVTADNLKGGYYVEVTASSLNGLTATCYVETQSLVSFDIDGLYYTVIPNAENEVAVMGCYDGTTIVNIPETIDYNGSVYSVTTVGPNAFAWRSEIEEVTIPSTVKLIREYNFNYCSSLNKVTIADSETTLELSDSNFTDDENLKELYVGRNLTHSGYCFSWVNNLSTIELGTEVTSLPANIFRNCGQLSLVKSNNPVPPVLGDRALGWNVQHIIVPAESVEAYKEAWEQYASLITLPVNAENISFETEEITIYTGQLVKLPIIVEPADALISFTSSRPNFIPVNKEGYVEYYWGDMEGEVIITAATLNGLTAECKVIAKHWLTFSEDNITLVPGTTYQVEVSRPDVIADAAITWWSANEEVATVDENGTITAVAGGDAEMYASVEVPTWNAENNEYDFSSLTQYSYRIRVKVRNYPTDVIAEEPTMTVWQGREQAIHLTYEPQDDMYLNHELTWTVADPEIVEVLNISGTDYSIRGLKGGTTTITGETLNGITVEIEVVVKAQIEDFIFQSDKAYVAPGGDYQLEFTTVPEETNQTFTYTSDNEEVATIDENGLIHGVALGSTQIGIWYEGPWGTDVRWYRVEVCNLPETVTLENNDVEMYVKETKQLNLVFTPEDVDLNKEMTWTVENPEIARIDGNNTWDPELGIERKSYEIVGLAEGTTHFVGTTVNGLTVEGDVTVQPLVGPEEVILENSEITLVFRNEEKLELVFTPNDENVDKEMSWTVENPEVATVYTRSNMNEETGVEETYYVVYGKGLGTTTVTGETVNGLTVHGTVTVEGIDIWYGSKDASRMNLTVGETVQLEIEASSEEIRNTLSFISYDENVMTVTPDGEVTAVAPGENWIDARYIVDGFEYYDDIWVVVHPASESISLNKTEVVLRPDNSVYLQTILPMGEEYYITWETSDPDVARIEPNWDSISANVYYVSSGTATITATAYTSDGVAITATCEVTCVDLRLNETDIIMGLDQTRQLEVLGIPENMEVQISWWSNNYDVVTVEEGVLTPVNYGSTYVGAYIYDADRKWIGEVSTYVDVVDFVYVTDILLNPTSIEANEGESVQIEATVMPADATDQQLSWSSSDDSVATVDQNGLVTIVAEGFAVITATATDGSGISANCYISGLSGINGIFGDGAPADVYDMNGILVKKDATADDFNKLAPGIYVVRRGNVSTKLIRR